MTTVRFAHAIKPLFTSYDRDQMRFAFDLWHYDDVKEYAAQILVRLEAGDMPCDEPWPAEQIAIFKSWMDQGHHR
jgi:hypothetical protein